MMNDCFIDNLHDFGRALFLSVVGLALQGVILKDILPHDLNSLAKRLDS